MPRGIACMLVAVGGLMAIPGGTVVGQDDGPAPPEVASPAAPEQTRVETADDQPVAPPADDARERDSGPIQSSDPTSPTEWDRRSIVEPFPDDTMPGPLRWRERLRAPTPYPPPTFFDPQMRFPGRGRVVVRRISDPFYLGVSLQPVGEALRSHLRLDPSVGLVVDEVAVDSPAATVLQRYDVLTEVDGQPITQHSDLVQAVQKAGGEERELKLNLIRAGQPQTVTVQPVKQRGGELIFRSESAEMGLPEGTGIWIQTPDSPGFQRLSPLERPGDDWFEQYRREHDELRRLIEQLRRDVDELRDAGQPAKP